MGAAWIGSQSSGKLPSLQTTSLSLPLDVATCFQMMSHTQIATASDGQGQGGVGHQGEEVPLGVLGGGGVQSGHVEQLGRDGQQRLLVVAHGQDLDHLQRGELVMKCDGVEKRVTWRLRG